MRGSRLVTTERVVCLGAPGTGEIVESVEAVVADHGITFASYEVGEAIPEYRIVGGDVLGVVVGGDGTFLRAAGEFAPREIPFVSVDAGTLGFLTVTPPDALEDAFEEILSGRATVTEHLQVRVRGGGLDETGLNEVQFDSPETPDGVGRPVQVLDGGPATERIEECRLEVVLDGEYVGRYEGGGLLVNTPTGSTAMALSAGGPVHFGRDNTTLQLTPLHTHNVGVRPLVFAGRSELSIVAETPVRVSVDGARPERTSEAGTRFTVTGAETPAYLVRSSVSRSVVDALTDKLGWSPGKEGTGERPATAAGKPQGPRQPAGSEISKRPWEATESAELAETGAYADAGRVAREAALAAGTPLGRIYDRIEGSASGLVSDDLVGAAISRSERIVTAIIASTFPDDAVVSEGWTVREGSGRRWVVDPLDGTGNFAHGNPSFAVAVALVEDGEPVVGVVYSPVTGDLFHAVRGSGAYRNESRIEPTDRESLDESMLLSGYDPTGEFLKRFYRRARGVRRLGSASLQLCYVAAGSADAHWEYDTYPWDVAAGVCILREAGGTATDADGTEYQLQLEDTGVRAPLLSSNGPLHEALLEAFPAEGF